MKRFKKILIVLSAVFVLFVSVFAVSASALNTTNLKFGLPSVNYVYNSGGYAYYSSASSLQVNSDGGDGSFGYNGSKYDNVLHGWRRFQSDTLYEYYQCASTSDVRYGIVIDMSYLNLSGRVNSAFDVGISFAVSQNVGTSDDTFQVTGEEINNVSARIRVYGLDGYYSNTDMVQNGTHISGSQEFTDFAINPNQVTYLSSILSQYYEKTPYISRIDIDLPYQAGYFTTCYFNFYTGGVDFEHLGNHYMPLNDSNILHSTYVNSFNNGVESGKSFGYADGYENGYSAGEQIGFEAGVEYGRADNELINKGMFSWIFDGIQGVMQFELFPNFSIGMVLSVICGASLFIWLLKLFAGG